MTGSSEARERAITEAARRLLDMLTLDGDPPALAIPDEIEDKNAFAQAFDGLSRALSAPSPPRQGVEREKLREAAARAVCAVRKVNPDAMHQNYSDDEPVDGYFNMYSFHGGDRQVPAHKGWRNHLDVVDAVLALLQPEGTTSSTARVAQPVEAAALNPAECRFDPDRAHQIIKEVHRLGLVIESAVRNADAPNHPAVLALVRDVKAFVKQGG